MVLRDVSLSIEDVRVDSKERSDFGVTSDKFGFILGERVCHYKIEIHVLTSSWIGMSESPSLYE